VEPVSGGQAEPECWRW